MTRTLWFLIKLAVVVAAAVWLAEQPATFQIDWNGTIYERHVGILVLAAVVLMAVAALAYQVWRGTVRLPRLIGRSRRSRRRERGYRALTRGLVAVAAGDAETARRYAREADGLLDEPPLTLLLSAQAAQLNGEDASARRCFESMLERQETEFLGLRGLISQALRQDQPVRALELAERARALSPGTPWVLRTCFELQVRLGRWLDAEESLAQAVRGGAIPANDGRHAKATVLAERGREAEAAGETDRALELTHRAVGLVPTFVPAVAREARLTAAAGRDRSAVRLVEKTWARAPHRLLAETYRSILPEGESPADRVKRFERLYKLAPSHRESLIALAEAELEAQLWEPARGHLTEAEALAPSRRVYRLLAELEHGEKGDLAAARNWLIKAEAAPPDSAWVCRQCGTVAPDWAALCGHCEAFASLEWIAPDVAVHLPASPDRRSLEAPVTAHTAPA